ncbi:carbohydrate-binding domain-containing protein [Candidatus Saccharibacteria bacterium]|nr:carbohydrate-binding domain-containing protein [Candidatus Saccharibacteria bacterium]
MNNEFNQARSKKASVQPKIARTMDPFQVGIPKPAPSPRPQTARPSSSARPQAPRTTLFNRTPEPPRPSQKPAPSESRMSDLVEPETPRTIEMPEPVAKRSTSEQKISSEPAPRRTNQSLFTRRTIIAFIIVAILAAVVPVTVILLTHKGSEPEPATSSEQPNTTQNLYPKNTATAIDISIATEPIQITEASHYILSGETTMPIVVNAPGEVVIYLNGISVSTADTAALSNLSGHRLTLILIDETITNLQTNQPDTIDALYSNGDLTIRGDGILNISGTKVEDGHEYVKAGKVNNLKII